MEKILITGGAGFIGSHVARQLLQQGYAVRVLDDLNPQVHMESERPDYLDNDVELISGDVRDKDAVCRALHAVNGVIHFAARVGVGQSMYEIAEYTSTNCIGTGILLESLADSSVERLVVASSMSVYGEGLYRGPDGQHVVDAHRTRSRLERDEWDPVAADGSPLEPVPTPEWKTPSLSSVYALTKFDQERLGLMFGDAYGVPTTALRFFNVYGPDQALSNPYTGVLAIFAARLLNDRPPRVFEDGHQRRDFVSVHDVARATRLALETPAAAGHVLNIGSGTSVSVLAIARQLARVVDKEEIEPEVTGSYRVGDIRHCFADITRARDILGFDPQLSLEEGMREMAQWLEGQVADDQVELATKELSSRGLTV